jgi:gamma-glutamyl:cysteine ligase YbdK (ATP-grasp superfamily)
MGREITTAQFSREDRLRYREKVKSCLAALRQLIDEGRFERNRRLIGIENEVYLVDADGAAMPINEQVLARIESADFQTELAQFNIEFDLKPRRLVGDVFSNAEDELRVALNHAHQKAQTLDAAAMIIGTLPTLTDFDVTEHNLTANPRYKALNDQILAQRGEDILIAIEGDETLHTVVNSIVVEGACTSVQLHLQVDPEQFAVHWNAAQALSAPLVAIAANSPFVLGKQLHHESRIALFEQATDTRSEELAVQGVRPRVWFGEKWLTEGIFELFDENVKYFPSLLPVCEDEDPLEMLKRGDVPHLEELSLHNGTIYRWNRPVYQVARGRPHMRIENRVLSAGPTVIDSIANAAFYYGLLGALVAADDPVWEHMSFETATENFFEAARHGIHAKLYWPRVGAGVPVTELVAKVLVPLARQGLTAWGVDEADVDLYLGIIEQRAMSGLNGASWQIATYHHLIDEEMLDRHEALREVVRRYQEHSHRGQPVHTWPVRTAA